MDQRGKARLPNLVLGQLRIGSRETGWAVASRVSLFIFRARAEG